MRSVEDARRHRAGPNRFTSTRALRLANDLVAKIVFTPSAYANSMARIVEEAERYREETPELFEGHLKGGKDT